MAAEVAAAETTSAKIATATAEGAREAVAAAAAEGRAVVMARAMTRSTVRAVVPTARCRQSTSPFYQVSSAFVGFDGFDLSIGWVHGSCRHWCTGRSWPARLPNRRWSLGRYPAGSTVVRQVESGGAVVAAEEPQATALAGE
eukprot:scaffold66011_cov54-Phaeocystis_antarctica.AAC.5